MFETPNYLTMEESSSNLRSSWISLRKKAQVQEVAEMHPPKAANKEQGWYEGEVSEVRSVNNEGGAHSLSLLQVQGV